MPGVIIVQRKGGFGGTGIIAKDLAASGFGDPWICAEMILFQIDSAAASGTAAGAALRRGCGGGLVLAAPRTEQGALRQGTAAADAIHEITLLSVAWLPGVWYTIHGRRIIGFNVLHSVRGLFVPAPGHFILRNAF